MIYPNENGVTILGNGFIANALKRQKNLPPALYAFSAPSSNVLFDQELFRCTGDTIAEIIEALEYCKATGTYLVYPSSATVYNKNTSYAKCKTIVETLVDMWGIPALGLRIAAGYGPGEAHKGKYASVIYQWCQQMKNDEQPTIFGDGTQTRDFIFEDDLATRITYLVRQNLNWKNEHPVIEDVGTGTNTSFNEAIAVINKVLGKSIEPIYVSRPTQYVQETPVKGFKLGHSLEDGVREIIKSL